MFKKQLNTTQGTFYYHSLAALGEKVAKLPFSIRILLESLLRRCDGFAVTEDDVMRLADWQPTAMPATEVPYGPGRVIMQDFTGVPAVVDLAAMRSAMARLGGNVESVNPLVPVDLVIDHSVQTDFFGTPDALQKNCELEMSRNIERYKLLCWAQKAFDNFRVVPPAVGIIHQVNLELLASVVRTEQKKDDEYPTAFPDTLVGTDSHTTMIGGLGVLGWGVGGIEAEAVMLGRPLYILAPEVIAVELVGETQPGVSATDTVLTIVEMLRKEGVVGKFVEFTGEAAAKMPVAQRAVIANMAPEYGATIGFFPVDQQTLDYLRLTGRDEAQVELVEKYSRENLLFREAGDDQQAFTKKLRLDLGTVEPCLAGPKRPQDRIPLSAMKESFETSHNFPAAPAGELTNGSVVIASITSCTNTSNPDLLIAAGLLAKKAVAKGLKTQSFVKTSLAPGSRVVTDYLDKAGLTEPLNTLGFNTVGYGCLTCIGNSGPLPEAVAKEVTEKDLTVAAVVSANRNFEGRVNPLVKANYLGSPLLVVAYALSGRVTIDFDTEPLGTDADGNAVMLADILPTDAEVAEVAANALSPAMFQTSYDGAFESNADFNAIDVPGDPLFPWEEKSTYIQEPPFMCDLAPEPAPLTPIVGARVLATLGDSVTTDHISPAGAIPADGPAGKFLIDASVQPKDFNSFGSRRGNDRVMTRGTLANIRIRNQLAPETEGGYTRLLPEGEVMSIYDAAMKYATQNVPLVILAGKEYGTGSSRDWAAKGTLLLGVKAVIAASFERIHRSNLVGMGVLPLELIGEETTWQSLGLTGEELFDIPQTQDLQPQQSLEVTATKPDGSKVTFEALVRIDTPVELEYYHNGGVLPAVLRKF